MKYSMDTLPPAGRPTALITGGTGFLGSHLLKRLRGEGYSIVLLKRSFSKPYRITEQLADIVCYDVDRTPLRQVFEDHRVDIVVHCATDYGRKNVEPTSLID